MYEIINDFQEVVSKHRSLDRANARLRELDGVHTALTADDVNWLKNDEKALQGYKYKVTIKL